MGMTSEKLINNIEFALGIGADYTLLTDDAKYIIKALEQDPCEDAISRADAIDLFGHGLEWSELEIQEAIRALPPVRSFCGCQQNDADTNVGKINAEIDRQQKWLLHAGYTAYNVDIALDAIKSAVAESGVEK